MDLKTSSTIRQDSSTNLFLAAAVVLANLDYSGLVEYAIKAAIGGFIWVAFKISGDWIASKLKKGKRGTV